MSSMPLGPSHELLKLSMEIMRMVADVACIARPMQIVRNELDTSCPIMLILLSECGKLLKAIIRQCVVGHMPQLVVPECSSTMLES